MASGAGLNRLAPYGGLPFFYTNQNGIATARPQTLVNASADSGPIAVEGMFFSKWGFQMVQIGSTALSGYTATIYGTLDPHAYELWQYKINPQLGGTAPTVPDSAWFVLPAPSEQTGTGTSTNPITNTGVILPYNLSPLVAVRCVLAAAAGATGTAQVYCAAIP